MVPITGGAAWKTTTSKVQTFVLPLPSSARTVTVVVPTGNVEPLAGVAVMFTTPEQASVAEGENVTFALFEEVPTVILAGQVIAGAVVSTTLTVRLTLAVPPCVSVAV